MRNTNQLPWLSPFTILSLLVGISIIFLGANFIIHPHAGATGYGVTVTSTDADAFLLAKGVRDIASGVVTLCLVALASKRAAALFLLSMTIVPVGDAIIVATTGGAPAYAVPMHAATALVMLVLSVLMLRRSSSKPSRASIQYAA
jgi:hypothetical protein